MSHPAASPLEAIARHVGETVYPDGDDRIVHVGNAATHFQSCEQAGVPRPSGILR